MNKKNRISYIVGVTKLNGYLLVNKTKEVVNEISRYKTDWFNNVTKDWIKDKLTTNIPTCSKLNPSKKESSSESKTIRISNNSHSNSLDLLPEQPPIEFEDFPKHIGRFPQTISNRFLDENIKVGETYVFYDFFSKTKMYVPKNSILIIEKIGKSKIGVYIQGSIRVNWFSESQFKELPITKQLIGAEYIMNYVRPSEGYKKILKTIRTLDKLFKNSHPELHHILKKIKQDTSYTKGNTRAANLDELNSEGGIPKDTKNGFKSKGYTWWENRSGRTSYVPTSHEIESWENSKYKHALGIKSTEQCTYDEMEKICKKMISEVCGMAGVSSEFIEKVKYFGINPILSHNDYWTGKQISLIEIRKNEHHSKEKGIEFCHIEPEKGTKVDNVTLGLSSSNRKQGGNSIVDLSYESTNAFRILSGLEPITKEEYQNRILN